MLPDFEWDAEKAQANLRKHRVSFDEAITVFDDPFVATIADPDHSLDEDRYLSIGLSYRGSYLVVSYTDRGNYTRIISCRKATALERKSYDRIRN